MEKKRAKHERRLSRCKLLAPALAAVAHPCLETTLRGALEAVGRGLLTPVLVGRRDEIEAIPEQLGIDISHNDIVDSPYSHAAAETAVRLVREGKAELLMKGSLHSDEVAAHARLRTPTCGAEAANVDTIRPGSGLHR